MDGVVADFDKAIAKIEPELETRDGPDYEERSKLVDAACLKHPRIFLSLEPIPGAINAVKKLLKSDKYTVYFLSSPMWALPECFMDKRIWLEDYFGDEARHRLILTKRKDLNIGDYLIDDTTRNGVLKFRGKHIHFATPDCPDWDAVMKILDV